MGDGSQTPPDKTITAIEAIANSKAGEKLANAIEGLVCFPQNVLDYIAGPDRIKRIGEARAEVTVATAKADAESARIRAETSTFVLDREMKKTLNREAIVSEAVKALPPEGAAVSDESVSPDFVHAFFDEFDGISDPEVHKIVGKLLAGEVVRPGSYPRRTMRVLRDLESTDFKKFTSLCSFVWGIRGYQPLVFEPADAVYSSQGIDYEACVHLEALGLIKFGQVGGFTLSGLPGKFRVAYQGQSYELHLSSEKADLDIGRVLFTDAGRRLAPLTNPKPVVGFLELVANHWRGNRHTLFHAATGTLVLPDTPAQLTG